MQATTTFIAIFLCTAILVMVVLTALQKQIEQEGPTEYVSVTLVNGEWHVEGKYWILRLKDNELDAYSSAKSPFLHRIREGTHGEPLHEYNRYYPALKEEYLNNAKTAISYLDAGYEYLETLYGVSPVPAGEKQEVVYDHRELGGHAGQPITVGFWLGEVTEEAKIGVETHRVTYTVRNLKTYFHEVGHNFTSVKSGFFPSQEQFPYVWGNGLVAWGEAFADASAILAVEHLQETRPHDVWLENVFKEARYLRELAENSFREYEWHGYSYKQLDFASYSGWDENGVSTCGVLIYVILTLEDRYPGILYGWDKISVPHEVANLPVELRATGIIVYKMIKRVPAVVAELSSWKLIPPISKMVLLPD